MLSNTEFRKQAHDAIDWIADYLESIEQYPVKSMVRPGEISDQISNNAPFQGESMEVIMQDFKNIIPKGITHWQHPGFMALFPSNASYESMLAEFLTAGLGINAMVWETSPAATELEEKMMNWLRDMFQLPKSFSGVIHDTASTSSLVAIISAREKYSNYFINEKGFKGYEELVMYCSEQTHYSIEKDAKAAGIGKENVRKIKTDLNFAMDVEALQIQIENDLKENKKPFLVVVALGTTSSLAFDPLFEIGKLCAEYNLWLHIDAAYAGSAFILPEYQHYLKGIEYADSYVVNAHKWLFTNFDCSVYFVKDAVHLINVFTTNPDYLKRTVDEVINYKDWGINLGRRFRALKLWFVLRSFGVEGLQQKLREHIRLSNLFYDKIKLHDEWEMMAPFVMNVMCLRYHPKEISDENVLNQWNEELVSHLNASGKLYLSGTKLHGKYVIRVVIGQTNVTEKQVDLLYNMLIVNNIHKNKS